MGIWVMPLAVLSYLGMCIGLSHYPLILMAEGVEWILDVAHYVSALEGAVIHLPVFSHIAFVLFVSAGLLMMIGPVFARLMAGIMFIIALFLPSDLPHILVSDNSKLVGYYDAGEKILYVSSLQYERYNREQWTRYLGSPNVEKWPEVGKLENIRCDESACRIVSSGVHISFPKTPYAFEGECNWADIIILTRPPSLTCKNKGNVHVIDRLATYYNGSVVVYIPGYNEYEIRTSKEVRGDRMWVR
jgi:competence protein ComEC